MRSYQARCCAAIFSKVDALLRAKQVKQVKQVHMDTEKKTYHDYHEHNIILYIYCNINCPQMFIINIHDIIYYNTIMNYYNMKHGQQKLHVALIRSALNKISWASEHCKGLQTNQP